MFLPGEEINLNVKELGFVLNKMKRLDAILEFEKEPWEKRILLNSQALCWLL